MYYWHVLLWIVFTLLPFVCSILSEGTVHAVLLKHKSVTEVPITKFSYTCKASVKFIHHAVCFGGNLYCVLLVTGMLM